MLAPLGSWTVPRTVADSNWPNKHAAASKVIEIPRNVDIVSPVSVGTNDDNRITDFPRCTRVHVEKLATGLLIILGVDGLGHDILDYVREGSGCCLGRLA